LIGNDTDAEITCTTKNKRMSGHKLSGK